MIDALYTHMSTNASELVTRDRMFVLTGARQVVIAHSCRPACGDRVNDRWRNRLTVYGCTYSPVVCESTMLRL